MAAARGEAHYMSKLTEDDIKEIRMDPRPQRIIAEEYGVSPTQIGYIKTERAWKHVE